MSEKKPKLSKKIPDFSPKTEIKTMKDVALIKSLYCFTFLAVRSV